MYSISFKNSAINQLIENFLFDIMFFYGNSFFSTVAGQGMNEGKETLYHCNYCNKDISGKIRIKCVTCPDYDLCVECFSVGAEVTPHKSNHPYRVMVSDPLRFYFSFCTVISSLSLSLVLDISNLPFFSLYLSLYEFLYQLIYNSRYLLGRVLLESYFLYCPLNSLAVWPCIIIHDLSFLVSLEIFY